MLKKNVLHSQTNPWLIAEKCGRDESHSTHSELLLIRLCVDKSEPKAVGWQLDRVLIFACIIHRLSSHNCFIFNVLPSDLTCLKNEKCWSDAKKKHRGSAILKRGYKNVEEPHNGWSQRLDVSHWPEGTDHFSADHVETLSASVYCWCLKKGLASNNQKQLCADWIIHFSIYTQQL